MPAARFVAYPGVFESTPEQPLASHDETSIHIHSSCAPPSGRCPAGIGNGPFTKSVPSPPCARLIADGSVPAEHRGTYLAFTDPSSAGMTHLRGLARAVPPSMSRTHAPNPRSHSRRHRTVIALGAVLALAAGALALGTGVARAANTCTTDCAQTSCTVDRNAVYVVSSRRMYRFSARRGRPHVDWKVRYRNSGIVKPGQVFHPIRVAVSGRTTGPTLFGMLELLGRETVVGRLRAARKLLAAA